jgi:hypothetical protein
VTARQKENNEKGFVGFETTWELFQKEDCPDYPLGGAQRFEKYVGDLRNQQRQHDIGRADLEHVASFQFFIQPQADCLPGKWTGSASR